MAIKTLYPFPVWYGQFSFPTRLTKEGLLQQTECKDRLYLSSIKPENSLFCVRKFAGQRRPGVSFLRCLTLFSETGRLPSSERHSLVLGFEALATPLGFLYGFWVSNSGSQACTARTSPTELPPQPSVNF